MSTLNKLNLGATKVESESCNTSKSYSPGAGRCFYLSDGYYELIADGYYKRVSKCSEGQSFSKFRMKDGMYIRNKQGDLVREDKIEK